MPLELVTQRLTLKDINPDLASRIGKEYGIKEADIPFIRKGITPADVKFEDGERASVDYISTFTKDRDGEIVDPSGAILGDYLKHPVVLFAHNYKMLPIGRAAWVKQDEKGLIAKTIYASHTEADKVYQYRKEGFPMAKSIGFIPMEWKDYNSAEMMKNNGVSRRYTKWLLLEYSDVPVPSNPDALEIAMSKGIDFGDFTKTYDEYKQQKDMHPVPVIVETETVPHTKWICPHCKKEIGEKELYHDGTFFYHRPCKEAGPIELPKEDSERLIKEAAGEIHTLGWKETSIKSLVAEALQEMGIKTPETVIEKKFDLKGNMSVSDIATKFYMALNELDKLNKTYTWGWITDMYPYKYPEGGIVFAIYDSGGLKYYMYDYTIDKSLDIAVLGDTVEVQHAYQPKGIDAQHKKEVEEKWLKEKGEPMLKELDTNTEEKDVLVLIEEEPEEDDSLFLLDAEGTKIISEIMDTKFVDALEAKVSAKFEETFRKKLGKVV